MCHSLQAVSKGFTEGNSWRAKHAVHAWQKAFLSRPFHFYTRSVLVDMRGLPTLPEQKVGFATVALRESFAHLLYLVASPDCSIRLKPMSLKVLVLVRYCLVSWNVAVWYTEARCVLYLGCSLRRASASAESEVGFGARPNKLLSEHSSATSVNGSATFGCFQILAVFRWVA